MCSAAELSNKIKYPTFGRTFPVDSQVGPSLISLLKYTYNWTIVAVVCQNSPKWTSLKEHLLEEFENNGIFVSREYIVTNPASYSNNRKYSEEFSEALRDMKQKARSKLQGLLLQYILILFEKLIDCQISYNVCDLGYNEEIKVLL